MRAEHRAGYRRRIVAALAAVAAVSAMAGLAACGDDEDSVAVAEQATAAEHEHSSTALVNHSEAAHEFHDAMRKLWEDHVTWTRLAIVSFLEGLPDLDATVKRLLDNQADIGDAIKPYYGAEAGDRLTKLLEGHINGAVTLLTAATEGTDAEAEEASAAWYRNGNRISDFLAKANPDNWPRADLRSMMKTHLDQTLDEATLHIEGDYEAEVKTYDEIHDHILEMADALSNGIIAQFPERFE